MTQLTFTCSYSRIWALKKRFEICSKLTIKTPERRHWRLSGVFIVKLGKYFTPFSSASIIDFEQVNFSWGASKATVLNCFYKWSF